MAPPRVVVNLFAGFEFRTTGKWFVLSLLVGTIAGLAAILFQFLSQVVLRYTLEGLGGYRVGEASNEYEYFEAVNTSVDPLMILVVMTVGGLVTGLLVQFFAPEAGGAGTDAVVDAFHNHGGRIHWRVPFVKTVASAVTLGTGGSAGREGPIAQIGGGIGSWIADRLKLSTRDRRIMLAAGMAAGVGAIFRAPLAAALFAGEILYRDGDLESDVIVPAAMSSIIGYSVYCLALPSKLWFSPLFGTDFRENIVSPLELVSFTGLALAIGVTAIVYVSMARKSQNLFAKLPGPTFYRPALGALLAGLIGVGLFLLMQRNQPVLTVLSVGYDTLQAAFDRDASLDLRLLLVIGIVKMVTTSLTIGSGGAGGFFGPSMVIGGCLGAAFGQAIGHLRPETFSGPHIYALVGMAGFFAACANAPFSTIVMVSEMTGEYRLLLPSMWVTVLCVLLCRKYTLYRNQLPTRLESPAHRGDFIVDLLEDMSVRDVYRPDAGDLIRVPEAMTLDQIVHLVSESHQHYFPVIDSEGRLVGIFSAHDVRAWYFTQSIWKLAVARDLMHSDPVTVTPEDSLNTAIQFFTALNIDELPVLDAENEGTLIGMLRRKETIAAYNDRLKAYKQSTAE